MITHPKIDEKEVERESLFHARNTFINFPFIENDSLVLALYFNGYFLDYDDVIRTLGDKSFRINEEESSISGVSSFDECVIGKMTVKELGDMSGDKFDLRSVFVVNRHGYFHDSSARLFTKNGKVISEFTASIKPDVLKKAIGGKDIDLFENLGICKITETKDSILFTWRKDIENETNIPLDRIAVSSAMHLCYVCIQHDIEKISF